MPVYLIRAGDSGPVKIGHARNPARRMKALQTAHYERLTLLRTWPGDQAKEAALHRAFSDYRMQGEWFRFCEGMLTADPAELIAEVDARPVGHGIALSAIIEAHLAETGTPPSVFGMQALGDPNFVRNLRAGREPREKIREKVISTIQQRQAATTPAERAA